MPTKNHFIILALRHSLKHPIQSFLLIIGVALGVAMAVAIDLANTSAGLAFALSTDSIAGKATHQIVAATGDVPEELYRMLRADLGLRNTAPAVTGLVLLPAGDDLPLQLLGVDPFAEAPFRSYLSGGAGGLSTPVLAALLVEPNTVVLSQNLGERYNLTPGDTFEIFADNQTKTVKLVALLTANDALSAQAIDGLMLADISTAQELLGKVGYLSHIDLILPPDAPLEPLTALLPENIRLQRAAVRNETLDQMTAAFELNLSALSLLGLVVGMFLIYNTISFSVLQRRPTLGILRCLGVTRREIFALVLSEAFILSALGTFIGLALGIVLGRGLVNLVTQTINDLFFRLTVQATVVQPLTLLKGIAAGLGAGLLAAFIPALEATTVSPVNALRRSVAESRAGKLLPILSIVGLAMILGGGLALQLPSQSIVLSFSALFLILIGISFLTPLLTQLAMRLLQPLISRAVGIIGLMASRDIVRSFSRTSVTIAALMVSISVIIGVSVMISSFRTTVVSWLNAVLQADVYVSPARQTDDAVVEPEFVTAVQNQPEVDLVALARNVTVLSDVLGPLALQAYSTSPLDDRESFLWMQDPAQVALADDEVVISEVFARRKGLPVNRPSEISLLTATDGPKQFKVVGVFYDYASPEGYIALNLESYRHFWQDTAISNVALYVASNTDLPAFVDELQATYAGPYQVRIVSNRGIKDEALTIFDRTFTITAALRLLATVVAFIGVLSALMALQLERTRELGTLRANGLTIRQLWGLTFTQTALIGLVAGLIAIPAGLILALVLIYVINLRSFGWSLQLTLEPQILLMALLVALVASTLAGVYPALRLSRLQISTALREE